MARHEHPTPVQSDGFRILAVCTGNICRSPLAEQLLRSRLPLALQIDPVLLEVTSAGTMAQQGHLMEALSVAEAVRLGVADAGHHRARLLVHDQIERADLVLAMAVEHRSASVRAAPRAHARTFTLIEFARVVELLASGALPHAVAPMRGDAVPTFLRDVVRAAAAARGLVPPAATRHLDIDDPYGRSSGVYRRSADAVADHVDRLALALAALARG